MDTIVALLPMKGHSERVPNKNIRSFAGQPLLHHILNTLQKTERIKEVIINTDSDKIEELSAQFSKVRFIRRPDKLCGDFVSMNDIISYDITNSNHTHFLQTHSTNPLLRHETLDKAIQSYFDKLEKYDSLFSVTAWQTRLYWADGSPVNHSSAELLRTQDLPTLYEENSNIFIFSKQSFAAAGNTRIGLTPQMFPMDKLEAVDIDTEEDFRLAEIFYSARQGS